ncbi:MAG: chromate transporter [Kiritimatiellae bacterium]|nr:chromate transporter [Kiritimatiellia bacterium]
MKLFRLFLEMFRIALFVVGGGYAIIAVADDTFSRKLKWTKEGELVDALSLFQTFPGIMAGHCAVYVGRKVAGVAGSVVALAGVILPSLVIFTCVSMGYGAIPLDNPWLGAAFAGLRAALTGVIAGMVVRGWRKSVVGRYGYSAMLVGLALLLSGANPALVLVAAMLVGVILEFIPVRAAGSRRFNSLAMVVPIFLKYGALAFGGGYVLVPMYISDFVGEAARFLQLPSEEFANLMALTQMTPGPIGINAATFFGFRLGGIPGAVLATFALVLPGSLMLSLALASMERFSESRVVKGIFAGVRPVTMSLMLSAAWSFAGMSIWSTSADGGFFIDIVAVALAGFAAFATIRKICGVMQTIFICAFASLAIRAVCGRCF